MNQEQVKSLIEQVIAEVVAKNGATETRSPVTTKTSYDSGAIRDLSAVDFKKIIDVPNPYNIEDFKKLREKTVARVGVWRAGPRYRTNTYLRFCSDHAAAMDAVFNDVNPDLLTKLSLKQYITQCDSKDTFLTRPDLGRIFSDETAATIKKDCVSNPDVQIIISDGLSSTAVDANMEDLLPALLQGLSAEKINVGTPIFVKYGRVGAMDSITEILGSKVTVILLGERPGLASGESLSAYMTYGGYVGIPEASRTVVSNIHRGGTNAAEAGAFVAELCARMLREKVSGLDFKI